MVIESEFPVYTCNADLSKIAQSVVPSKTKLTNSFSKPLPLPLPLPPPLPLLLDLELINNENGVVESIFDSLIHNLHKLIVSKNLEIVIDF